jgi:hypothetical protein
MHRYRHITALFGAPEDTLHVTAGWPSACYETAARSGMIYRYAPIGNRPCGVRIAGFLARWGKRRDQAYAEIARFLGVDPADVSAVVEAQIVLCAGKSVDLRPPGSRRYREIQT